jgi:hypothetical protein
MRSCRLLEESSDPRMGARPGPFDAQAHPRGRAGAAAKPTHPPPRVRIPTDPIPADPDALENPAV